MFTKKDLIDYLKLSLMMLVAIIVIMSFMSVMGLFFYSTFRSENCIAYENH
jgi:hypothetical protein